MLTWLNLIYFALAVCSFKAGSSPEAKGYSLTVLKIWLETCWEGGIYSWCYDEVFKHHINGASTQTKAIALQWKHHKITNCYLSNQVISTDISLLATGLFSFKEVRRNSMKARKCHYLDIVQVSGQTYPILLNINTNTNNKYLGRTHWKSRDSF